jgi:hypothetical protein
VKTILLATMLNMSVGATPPDATAIANMLPKNHQGFVPDEGKRFFLDWRGAATRYAQMLSENPDVRRAVGEPLDRQGALCILWTRMHEGSRESLRAVQARATAMGHNAPQWMADAVRKAGQKAEEECKNPGDDDKGHRRPRNLGLRYMETLKGRPEARTGLEALEALGAVHAGQALLLPIRVAPAGPMLPLLGSPEQYTPERLRESPDAL